MKITVGDGLQIEGPKGKQTVPLPAGTALLIAHSRVRRGLVDSAYNERRRQCEAAERMRDATSPECLMTHFKCCQR